LVSRVTLQLNCDQATANERTVVATVGSGTASGCPKGCDVDANGDIFVATERNNILKISPTAHTVELWAGAFQTTGHVDGSLLNARFEHLKGLCFRFMVHPSAGIAISETTGDMVIADCKHFSSENNGYVRIIQVSAHRL